MQASLRGALESVQQILRPVLDIVAERVDTPHIPGWCSSRGWSEFLLALSDRDLERAEAAGLAEIAPALTGAPPSLRSLALALREGCMLPRLERAPAEHDGEAYRGVRLRKRQQLSALLDALADWAPRAERIVDVGAGSGHFTRLSAAHFGRATLGLERNQERVARARVRFDEAGSGARFEVIDAVRQPLTLHATDLAIGLHACGELGDALVKAASVSGADLVLISCCLQKISTEMRHPLSAAAGDLSLHQETLGLSNLSPRAVGVESSIGQTMQARQARYALRSLLLGRGEQVLAGAEMRGINRRRAHAGLSEIARQALAERRLVPASADEIAAHEALAAEHFAVMRRLSLPRNMLARLVELAVVLDRALHLEEHGHAVLVATLFEGAVTPRNIALFASTDGSRLPSVHRAAP